MSFIGNPLRPLSSLGSAKEDSLSGFEIWRGRSGIGRHHTTLSRVVWKVYHDATLMKFACLCGETIRDTGNTSPWMGHIIPDQEWFQVFDTIERIIDDTKSGLLKGEAAYMQMRNVLQTAAKTIYQCGRCGRLFVFEPQDPANIYKPEFETTSKQILRARQENT